MVIGSSSLPHLVLCNFCNVNEATVKLHGYFNDDTEVTTLLACKGCALKALDTEDHN